MTRDGRPGWTVAFEFFWNLRAFVISVALSLLFGVAVAFNVYRHFVQGWEFSTLLLGVFAVAVIFTIWTWRSVRENW
jgi:uncharacterized membrane protein YsdA (DUF1294 family)